MMRRSRAARRVLSAERIGTPAHSARGAARHLPDVHDEPPRPAVWAERRRGVLDCAVEVLVLYVKTVAARVCRSPAFERS